MSEHIHMKIGRSDLIPSEGSMLPVHFIKFYKQTDAFKKKENYTYSYMESLTNIWCALNPHLSYLIYHTLLS